jgi:NAD+ diphosphatase
MSSEAPFEGSFDRASELRGRPEAMAAARGDAAALYLPIWRNRSLVDAGDPPAPVFLTRAQAAPFVDEAECEVFLGRLGPRPCWALGLPGEKPLEHAFANGDFLAGHPGGSSAGRLPASAPLAFNDLRLLGPTLPSETARLLAYARAIVAWHRAQRCCGRCGQVMRAEEGGHMRLCVACGTRHFPRTDPAMMALVRRGDRILLARQPRFPPRMVSILAGFVEPGESIEESVVREVHEEVGLEVRDLRYLRSQPWPFPASLMIGFSMWSDEGDIVVDGEELEAAGWYDRDQIRAATEIFVPPTFSLAGQLIEMFLTGALDR